MAASGDSDEPPGSAAADPAAGGPTGPAAAGPALPGGAPVRPSLGPLVAAGGLYVGLLFAFVSLAGGDVLERAEGDAWAFLGVQLLDDGILAGVAVLFGRLGFPGSWPGLGFRRVGVRWWAIGAAAGAAAAAMAWVVSAVLEAGGQVIPSHPVETLLSRVRSLSDLLLVLAAVTVPVAVGEEAFFRGLAYRVLRARWGVPLAVTVSAVLFALVHGLEPGAWLPVLPVGLVLAGLVEWSGSLVPAMVGHAVVNALAVLIG